MRKSKIKIIFVYCFLTLALQVFLCQQQACGETLVYVASGAKVFQRVNSEKARVFVEPGTPLRVDREFKHNQYYRVLTPSGIYGYMKKDDIRRFKKLDENGFAFVKNKFSLEGKLKYFTFGEFYPVLKNDAVKKTYTMKLFKIAPYYDEDVECKCIVEEVTIESKYYDNFVYINNEVYKSINFKEWAKIEGEPLGKFKDLYNKKYGCGKSLKITKSTEISLDSEIGAGFSLWTWLSANLTVSASHGNEIAELELKDDSKRAHRFTLWKLSEGDNEIMLLVEVEKLWNCAENIEGGNEIIYRLNFPYVRRDLLNEDEEEIAPIDINHKWIRDQKLDTGGAYPIRANTYTSYNLFIEKFTSYYSLDDRIEKAIADLVVRIASNP
jgi:hypothetical protein